MTGAGGWLLSPMLSVVVGMIVMLALAASALRERWLGDAPTVDPALVGLRASWRARLLRAFRTAIAMVLALAVAALVVTTAVRFAVLSAPGGLS